MDRLDELAVLVAVVDHGSLIAAARHLRRSPPAITRALSALEDRVGARLVERTTRRLAPTAAGRALAEESRALLTAYDTAVSGISPAPIRGLIRVTAPVQFGRRHVAPLVAKFLDVFPETQVELVLHDRNLDLIEEGLDVAFRIGKLSDSSLLVRRVGEVRRVLVASPDYLKRRGAPVKPADLAAHDTIFGTATSAALEWRFGSGNRVTVIRIAPRLLVNEVEAQLVAARAGRGIARVLSYQVVDDISAGNLVRLLRPFEPPPVPVQLVAVSRVHMPQKVRAFLDYAADQLRKLRVIRSEAS
jgi:DNA-binding transcriptional LysR family regulator